jgi:hypothetical protein|tara:strand:+ start:285 stop:491 length:207 start_codon:yes stop_codon:yes gene_type:complete
MSKKKRMERRKSIDDKPVWAVVLHDEWDHEKYIITDTMTYEKAKMEMTKIDTKDDSEISYHRIEQIEI